MTAVWKRRIAWGLTTLCVVAFAVTLFIAWLTTRAGLDDEGTWRFDGIIGLVFPLVGALIVSRQPGNRIAWLFSAIGLSATLGALLPEYAHYATRVDSSWPGGEVAAWAGGWVWLPFFMLVPTFLFLLFPGGHLPSRGWKPIAYLAGISLIGLILTFMVLPYGAGEEGVGADPFGIDSLEAPLNVVAVVFGVGLGVSAIASIYSLFWRRRRASARERQQLKWFAYTAALTPVLFMTGDPIGQALSGDDVSDLPVDPSVISFLVLPVALGIAITRYRLYDIDRIISRTLVYGAVTALLVLAYAGGVVVIQTLLPVSNDSPVVVAASTLAVVALFRPLRNRVQGLVDRRFYRRRYDAARTIESFGSRLRQETDLDSLSTELIALVRDTMQPAHASLWLRSFQEPAS